MLYAAWEVSKYVWVHKDSGEAAVRRSPFKAVALFRAVFPAS